MLDTHARKYVNPIIELGAEFLLKLKLTPNNVTILALLPKASPEREKSASSDGNVWSPDAFSASYPAGSVATKTSIPATMPRHRSRAPSTARRKPRAHERRWSVSKAVSAVERSERDTQTRPAFGMSI